MDANFFSFTEELNAIDYLEKAQEFMRKVQSNSHDWKWVMISLHGALYSFAVIVARGVNDRSVINKDEKLISIWRALEICAERNYILQEEINDKDIQRFVKEFRNGFEHYQPGIWTIQLDGLPRISQKVISLISKLRYSHSHFYFEKGEEKRLDDALETLQKSILSFL